jgi:hypothetical protein
MESAPKKALSAYLDYKVYWSKYYHHGCQGVKGWYHRQKTTSNPDLLRRDFFYKLEGEY